MAALKLLFLLVAPIVAQFVPAPKDLKTKRGYAGINVRYKQVPHGICELDPSVKSYSGYVDVAENEHLFFWFFEARDKDPKTAPLTVWINGGPGSSSMIGLFAELGPCGVDSAGKVYNNPYSWSKVSNMLFVDQPVTVGLSYSVPVPAYAGRGGHVLQLPDNHCPSYAAKTGTCGTYSSSNITLTGADSTISAAPNFWKMLQGFMGAFPQYSRGDFHFTTESYGGHYGPVFNEYFEKQNKNLPKGAHKINLKSVMIGNGWYDPLIQYQAYYNYTVFPGNPYDVKVFDNAHEHKMYNSLYGPGNCVDQTKYCYATKSDKICSTADTFCAQEIEAVYDRYAKRDEYDIRELSPDPFPYFNFISYMNTPKVQAALGAYQNYSTFSPTVGAAFAATGDDDRKQSAVGSSRKLIAQGVNVVMYAGDADYNCNWLGGQAVAEEINAPGYSRAGYVNITSSDGIVHGQVRQSANYAFARIYESGHTVPFYQPLVSLEMFDRVINNKDVATGKVTLSKSYKTSGPKTSNYREGNGTVQYHVTPPGSTYNTTTNEPNPPKGGSA